MPVIRVFLAVAVSLYFHLSIALCSYAVVPAGQWEEVSSGIRGKNLHTISASSSIPEIAFVSAEQAVYKTANGGSSWEEVLSFRGRQAKINTVLISPVNNDVVYAGTDDGLYRSTDGGVRWERVFNSIGNLQRSVLAVYVNPSDENYISIGTRSGYFRTDNAGTDWSKIPDIPSETVVTSLEASRNNPDIIYAVTGRGLYKSLNNGAKWEKVLRSNYLAAGSGLLKNAETNGDTEIQLHGDAISIAIHPDNSEKIFAATSAGMLVSENGAQTWEAAGSSSLFIKDIQDIVMHGAEVYTATPRGVFIYSETTDKWRNMYQGLVSTDIRSLESSPAHVWAVSRNRVFKSTASEASAYTGKSDLMTGDILTAFAHEPTVQEIREAAIQYAEVSQSKIVKWRKAASRKAWLPDFRFAYSKDKYWQTSPYFYSGRQIDDDIIVDKDEGWSVSLTWELGDLIWNNDQTSIDNRSKLMVQLRDDILNEVTRLYFERRKLQVEMMLTSSEDLKEGIEKELRLQELTAGIDSLTGSYLSKKLNHVSQLRE